MPKQIVSEGDSERVWTPREILDYHTNTRREDGDGIIFIDESGENVFSKVDVEGKGVLIWGCGMGQYAFCAAARRARNVVGFDIDEPTITVARQLANYANDETLIKVCERGDSEFEKLSHAMAHDELTPGGDERISFVKADATQPECLPVSDNFDVQIAVDLLQYVDVRKRTEIMRNMLAHAANPCLLRIIPNEGSIIGFGEHVKERIPVPPELLFSNYFLLDGVAQQFEKVVYVQTPGSKDWLSKDDKHGREFDVITKRVERFLIKEK